ncbi:MAG: ABC transporter substrate-binding protein [Chloroflexi bacterium]|nr:ABC transporter substrate-binding protein [Chloroflexota bacterium]
MVTHPSIDATIQGIKQGMEASGFVEGKNVKYVVENAQGQVSNARAIAEKMNAENLDLIVPLTTPNSQAMVKVVSKTPVVFGMVTDPVQAGLVPSYDKPSNTNVTGVYNFNPVEQQFDDFHIVAPNAKTIGIVYNAGEQNSVVLVDKARPEAQKLGLKTVDATVTGSNDVASATQSLVGRADAIYVPQDNTVVSAFDGVMKIANANKLPVFAGAPEQVQAGAILTVAYGQVDMGVQIGKMMAQVLKGANPGSIAPQQPDKTELHLNKTAAASLGLTIPANLLSQAAQTY